MAASIEELGKRLEPWERPDEFNLETLGTNR